MSTRKRAMRRVRAGEIAQQRAPDGSWAEWWVAGRPVNATQVELRYGAARTSELLWHSFNEETQRGTAFAMPELRAAWERELSTPFPRALPEDGTNVILIVHPRIPLTIELRQPDLVPGHA